MQKVLLLALAGLVLSSTHAQTCLPGETHFTTQASVDNFQTNYPGCTHILGSVFISGTAITNLNGLSVLTDIDGSLSILSTTNLGSLTGLHNLTHIGGNLFVSGNALLTELSGLDGLETVDGNTTITGNSNLVSLAGLNNLTGIGGNLSVSGAMLANLTGLNSLTTVGGHLGFTQCPVLSSLAVLNNLSAVGGVLEVIACPLLPDLTGLNSIATFYRILLVENSGLTGLDGLNSLTTLTDKLHIQTCTSLNDLTALANLTDVSALYFSDNYAMTNLSGLENLTSVSSDVTIQNSIALTSLAGLNNLVSVGGNFSLVFNNALNDVAALSNLTTIGGSLNISATAATDLSPLSNLVAIGGSLFMSNNSQLTSLTGLDNIDYHTITNLFLQNSSNLSHCAVESICRYLDNGGSATINNNTTGCNSRPEVVIQCIPVLPVEMIQFVAKRIPDAVSLFWQTASETNNDYFEVQHSTDGERFVPLEQIPGHGTSRVPRDYTFVHATSDRQTLYYRLKQVDYTGGSSYSKVVNVPARAERIAVFPNPARERIFFSGTDQSFVPVRVTDSTGRLVLSEMLRDNMLDISKLPDGVYLLHILLGGDPVVQRIVKMP